MSSDARDTCADDFWLKVIRSETAPVDESPKLPATCDKIDFRILRQFSYSDDFK